MTRRLERTDPYDEWHVGDEISAAIEEIYAAVGEPQRWKEMLTRFSNGLAPELENHLEIARRIHEQQMTLNQQIQALSAVQAQLAIGALVVDERRTVLFANAVATRLLTHRSGLALTDNRLQAVDPQHEAVLAAAIAAASAGDRRAAPFVLIPRPGRVPVTLIVLQSTPASRDFINDDRHIVVLAFDADSAPLPSTSVLRALFGFTAREAECATHLMRGHTIAETARLMGIGRNTARTFLARLTAKADCHSQAKLVALLLAIPTVSETS